MQIDLSCPVEVFRTVMPTEDHPAIGFTLFNLSDRVISAVEITARLLTAAGAEKERITYRGQALNGRPHSTFPMNIPCGPAEGAKTAEATVEHIWFAAGDTWDRDPENTTEYESNALPISRALTDLKYAAGENAVGYPSQQSGLWVCVCGRPNPDSESVCARCRQAKLTVFGRYGRETVEALIAQKEKQMEISSRSAREDTVRLQRIREEDYRKRKARRRRRIRLAIALGIAAAGIAGSIGYTVPALRYAAAERAMKQEEYEKALSILNTLGEWPGAGEKRIESEWRLAALEAEEAEDPETLEEASRKLRAGKSEEATALADTADIRRSRILLEQGDTAGARAALAAIDAENEERQQIEADCLFAEANRMMQRGEYESAREAFLQLGGYAGAREAAAECLYLPACARMEEGDEDGAIQLFSQISEYRDSREKTLICHYRKAEKMAAEGNLEGAAAEYLMAGEYEDASAKGQEAIYTLAEQAADAGNITDAQRLYASIPGFRDADERNSQFLFTMAARSYDDHEYLRALDLLRAMPQEYDDSEALHRKAAYQAGRNAIEAEDWESALLLMEEAGSYQDAAKEMGNAIEKIAEARLDAGDADGALEMIERIPGRKRYAELKKRAQELYAVDDGEETEGAAGGEAP